MTMMTEEESDGWVPSWRRPLAFPPFSKPSTQAFNNILLVLMPIYGLGFVGLHFFQNLNLQKENYPRHQQKKSPCNLKRSDAKSCRCFCSWRTFGIGIIILLFSWMTRTMINNLLTLDYYYISIGMECYIYGWSISLLRSARTFPLSWICPSPRARDGAWDSTIQCWRHEPLPKHGAWDGISRSKFY